MIVTSPIRSLGGLLLDHNKNDSRKQIGSLLQSVTLVPLQLPVWCRLGRVVECSGGVEHSTQKCVLQCSLVDVKKQACMYGIIKASSCAVKSKFRSQESFEVLTKATISHRTKRRNILREFIRN